MDDNWVFTEDDTGHELTGKATLASAARVLKEYRPEMAAECLIAAEDLFNIAIRKTEMAKRTLCSWYWPLTSC